jgi:putative ABC transport system permease protein
LVSTITGQANASDVDVIDTFNTGNAGSNDKFVYLPFDLARRLYDIEGAERLVVLLRDESFSEPARVALLHDLSAAGFDVEIKTWLELSAFYAQVRGLFDMIFGFIFMIVVVVVVMSVINAMSMTVVERTREIGTLRAIGVRRFGIVKLFAIEALILVAAGCALGLLATAVCRQAVNSARISYVPPNSSNSVLLLVDWDLPKIVTTFAVLSLLGLLAAYVPARMAARRPIIDSLGHV